MDIKKKVFDPISDGLLALAMITSLQVNKGIIATTIG